MIAFASVPVSSCDKSNSDRRQQALKIVAGAADGVLPWQMPWALVAAGLEPDVARVDSEDSPERKGPGPSMMTKPLA